MNKCPIFLMGVSAFFLLLLVWLTIINDEFVHDMLQKKSELEYNSQKKEER